MHEFPYSIYREEYLNKDQFEDRQLGDDELDIQNVRGRSKSREGRNQHFVLSADVYQDIQVSMNLYRLPAYGAEAFSSPTYILNQGL